MALDTSLHRRFEVGEGGKDLSPQFSPKLLYPRRLLQEFLVQIRENLLSKHPPHTNTVQIQYKYNKDSVQIQHKYSANTAQIQCKYSTNTIQIQYIYMYRKCKYTNEKVQKQLGRCFILLHSVIQCKLFRGNCILVEFLDVRSVTATTVKSQ